MLYIYFLYILYIWYHSFEKKEMSSTRDAGRRITTVEIPARRPEPLHRSSLLQKLRRTSFSCLPARWSGSPSIFVVWEFEYKLGTDVQFLITSPARNFTWNESLCFRFCKGKAVFKYNNNINNNNNNNNNNNKGLRSGKGIWLLSLPGHVIPIYNLYTLKNIRARRRISLKEVALSIDRTWRACRIKPPKKL